jgi:hypothetical protein
LHNYFLLVVIKFILTCIICLIAIFDFTGRISEPYGYLKEQNALKVSLYPSGRSIKAARTILIVYIS